MQLKFGNWCYTNKTAPCQQKNPAGVAGFNERERIFGENPFIYGNL